MLERMKAFRPDPGRHMLASSASLHWQGISIEHRRHDPGAWDTPALSGPLVCVYIGQPIVLGQRRDEAHRDDPIVAGVSQIVPAGVGAIWKHREPAEFLALSLSSQLMASVSHEVRRRGGGHLELVNGYCLDSSPLTGIARALHAEVARGGCHGPLYAEGLGVALAGLLLRTYSTAVTIRRDAELRLGAKTLRRVLAYINDHLSSTLSLSELATLSGISISHFSLLFRQATGFAPHEFVIRQRVVRAAAMLRKDDMSTADIAASVGFYDQSHLTRHMRRILDRTPRELRDPKQRFILR
jgi:AraC family transcriptional regulator